LIHLRRLVEFLAALNGLCDARLASSTAPSESMHTVSELVSSLGSKVDGVNLVEIEAYLRSSKIARKISGYNEKEAEKESNGASNRRKGATPPLHAVETFILTLTNANESGRVFVNVQPPSKDGNGVGHVTLKYQLLNPSREFKEVVDSARSVILVRDPVQDPP
jgi:chromosome transmission fidelity protein 1